MGGKAMKVISFTVATMENFEERKFWQVYLIKSSSIAAL